MNEAGRDMLDRLLEIGQGNPGAITFMAEAITYAEKALDRMKENGIVGDKIYILWNDCCDRDTGKALHVMATYDIDDIMEHITGNGIRGIKFE